MKYNLIPTDTIEIKHPVGMIEGKMFRGIPWSISVKEKDGIWYSKWQVECHYPSPTGDASDWCSFEIGCLNREQAIIVAKEYADRLGIPGNRVAIQGSDGYYKPLEGEDYMGRLLS